MRPKGGHAWQRPGLQTQVREGLLNHRVPGHGVPGVRQAQTVLETVCTWLTPHDRRDDFQLAAAVRAVRHVDLESAASEKTNLYPSYVVSKTRLSSLAQLSRTGR